MEFSKFANHLYPIISGEKAKDVFLQELFLNIVNTADGKSIIENTALSSYRSYYSGERSINLFSKKIRKYLEPSCFEEYINSLSDEQREEICSEFSDEIIDINTFNVGEKISTLFANIIIEASNKTSNKKNDICNTKLSNNKNTSKESNQTSDIDSLSDEIKDEARRFCIEHENEKELFALCQVAFELNPMHKHARNLYTDYNKCNRDVRNTIMKMNELPLLHFEDLWVTKYLNMFREDIEKLNLCNDMDLLYEGGKYLHKAMNYPSEPILDEYKYAFPTIILNHQNKKKGNLTDFIDEYIRNNYNLTLNYKGDPPLNWMINKFKMTDASVCSEKILAILLNQFVFSVCLVIPSKYKRKTPNEVLYFTPDIDNIEFLEDLYYAALLNLYSIYC